jgi:biotin carboxylase
LADRGVVVDIKDVELLIKIGHEERIAGVFCHGVEIPNIVARVAQSLKLPGLDPIIADLCTNKSARIRTLKSAGIPVAEYVEVTSKEQLWEISTTFELPLVIKPIDNAGSRGVQLVLQRSDLYGAYDEALSFSGIPRVLVEQYLQGPQISTESVIHNGWVHTFAFADRNYARADLFAPYFIEDGINYPSIVPNSLKDEVLDLVERTIKVLGIDFGAAKGDIVIHNGVPHIIEMACRTSGGWFSAGSIPAATGVDALKPLLQMSMGEEPDINALTPTRQLGCAQRYWIPTRSSIFYSAIGLDKIRDLDGVEAFDTFFPDPGTRLEKARHHAQRYAQVICTAQDRSVAIARAEAAIQSIRTKEILL